MDDSTSSDGEWVGGGVTKVSAGSVVSEPLPAVSGGGERGEPVVAVPLVTDGDEWVEGGVTEVSAGSVVSEPLPAVSGGGERGEPVVAVPLVTDGDEWVEGGVIEVSAVSVISMPLPAVSGGGERGAPVGELERPRGELDPGVGGDVAEVPVVSAPSVPTGAVSFEEKFLWLGTVNTPMTREEVEVHGMAGFSSGQGVPGGTGVARGVRVGTWMLNTEVNGELVTL
jgi:hypothetical protein